MFDIITDSACDLTLDTAKQLQIEVVPFYVSLDGEHYRKEGKEIAVRDFYQFMVDNPSAYPKTSLASIEDFEQAFRAHAAAGRDVLCLVFTSKMSGCVGSARNARDLVLEDFPDARIEVIDSAAATVTESTMAENAGALRGGGRRPAQTEGRAAGGTDLHGDLIGGAAHTAGLDFQAGHDILHGLVEHFDGVFLGLLLDLVEGTVDHLLGHALLAIQHDTIDQPGDQDGAVNGIRQDLSLGNITSSGHFASLLLII